MPHVDHLRSVNQQLRSVNQQPRSVNQQVKPSDDVTDLMAHDSIQNLRLLLFAAFFFPLNLPCLLHPEFCSLARDHEATYDSCSSLCGHGGNGGHIHNEGSDIHKPISTSQ